MDFQKLFKPLKKLQWKLTLSYTSVTIGSLVVVVAILSYLLFSRILIPYQLLDTALTPKAWINTASRTTSAKWQYILSQDPVDPELVSLALLDGDLQISYFDLFQIGDLQVRARTLGEGSVTIFDKEGKILGCSDPDFIPPEMIGQELDTTILPGLEGVLEAAYSGKVVPEDLFVTITPYEEFYFAIPQFSEDQEKILAVSLVYFSDLPTENDLPSNIATTLANSVLLLLLGAGIIGTIFGALTARGMANRLRRVSKVTEAWSKGDFSEFIKDPQADEISQLAQQLNHMARQLEDLLDKRQEMAVSEERNRLARELHDSAKQEALAASFQLGTALTLFDRDPQTAQNHLKKAEELIDAVRLELTDLILQLRPETDNGKKFPDTLQDYLIDWAHQNDRKAKFIQGGEGDIPLDTKQTIYRIMQEALSNVARHSQAEHIRMSLDYHRNGTEFCIEDDGIGFDPNLNQGGVGLNSMRERALAMGGTLRVESTPETGTSICVQFPYQITEGKDD